MIASMQNDSLPIENRADWNLFETQSPKVQFCTDFLSVIHFLKIKLCKINCSVSGRSWRLKLHCHVVIGAGWVWKIREWLNPKGQFMEKMDAWAYINYNNVISVQNLGVCVVSTNWHRIFMGKLCKYLFPEHSFNLNNHWYLSFPQSCSLPLNSATLFIAHATVHHFGRPAYTQTMTVGGIQDFDWLILEVPFHNSFYFVPAPLEQILILLSLVCFLACSTTAAIGWSHLPKNDGVVVPQLVSK